MLSAWSCFEWGYQAAQVASCAGALLPHRFSLACDGGFAASAHRRFVLCCTTRQVAPTWLSPAFCPVKPRLSSMKLVQALIHRGHPAYSPSRSVYGGQQVTLS